MSQKTLSEKIELLSIWIGEDVRGWREKKIHAVYKKEEQKRIKKYNEIMGLIR